MNKTILMLTICVVSISIAYVLGAQKEAPVSVITPECTELEAYEEGFHDGAIWFKDKILEYNASCEDCEINIQRISA